MATQKQEPYFTVDTPHPVTGRSVMDVLQSFADTASGEVWFTSEQTCLDGDDLFTIGLGSKLPFLEVKVVPGDREDDFFRPEERYASLCVVSHSWPTLVYHPVGYEDTDVIEAVRNVAAGLHARLKEED